MLRWLIALFLTRRAVPLLRRSVPSPLLFALLLPLLRNLVRSCRPGRWR